MKIGKIAAVLLALALLVPAAGCGSKEVNTVTEADTETETAEEPAEGTQAAEDIPAVTESAYDDLLFDTEDLDGNPVRSTDLFAQHRITVVNVWMTWCGPCVGEMPALAALDDELAAQDVGLVGVCMDAVDDETVAEARKILEGAGADFPVLKGFDGGEELFQLYAVPTTFFVDSEGHVLGEPVIGADLQQYRDTVARLLK